MLSAARASDGTPRATSSPDDHVWRPELDLILSAEFVLRPSSPCEESAAFGDCEVVVDTSSDMHNRVVIVREGD